LEIKGNRILVLGGSGFIGSHLVDRLIDEKPESITVMDNFYLGKEKMTNLASAKERFPSLKVYSKDASKMQLLKEVIENENIEVVFNLAVVCLPFCFAKPKFTYDINVKIVSSLCELLRTDFFKTLIHFSSSEAYGDAVKVPMDENHPLEPTTPYGASKIASDHLILSYVKLFGIDCSIVRPFNAYGPRQNEKTYAGVIPLTIRRILGDESPVIYGDGLQTRDYTYVTDVADAAIKVYLTKSTRGRVLNIASNREITIKTLVSKIAELMKCKREIIYGKPRPGDVRRFAGSNLLARQLIEFDPKVDFETGLRKTVNWYCCNIARNGRRKTC
jgi:UDP-glucose 4-epimerase